MNKYYFAYKKSYHCWAVMKSVCFSEIRTVILCPTCLDAIQLCDKLNYEEKSNG